MPDMLRTAERCEGSPLAGTVEPCPLEGRNLLHGGAATCRKRCCAVWEEPGGWGWASLASGPEFPGAGGGGTRTSNRGGDRGGLGGGGRGGGGGVGGGGGRGDTTIQSGWSPPGQSHRPRTKIQNAEFCGVSAECPTHFPRQNPTCLRQMCG